VCVILWPRVLGEGHELSVREFLKIYKLSRNLKTEYIFNFQGHQKIKFVLLPRYSSNKHWKERFFFAQGDWECLATEAVTDPRVLREVHRLSSSKQDEPILNESESAHVRELMQHAKKHATEMDFNAIFSQLALAACLKYLPTASVAVRGVLAKSKLKKKRKATTLQISESQSMEIAQLEAPILSSDKSSSGIDVGGKSEVFQEEISEPTMGRGTLASLKKQKHTLEAL
jgi:hypothetical protein